MISGVFRFRLNEDSREEFDSLYAEMAGHIANLDGYLGHKVFEADDGEYCVVVEFKDKEALEAWDIHPEHKKAKERGKAEVFVSYDVTVSSVFERHTKP